MRIVIAVLIFGLIILIHEFGHFLLAKKNKVTVLEFSLGMGPRLFSFHAGGTMYSLKVLPFGGSCMMLGEDQDDMQEGSFAGKSAWARIQIVAAGPIFNFILAYVLSCVIVGSVGYDIPVILNVSEGYAAEQAGLEPGDVITSINGKKIHLYREVSNYNMFHQDDYRNGKPVLMEYLHNGEKKTAVLQPMDSGNGRYILGIRGSSNYRVKASPTDILKYGAWEVKFWIETTMDSLKMMIKGDVSLNDVSGPVGVVDLIGDVYEQSKPEGIYYVWLNMLNIAILLTTNLGVMNLLPIPALDGGRLVFLIIEVIRRKRINADTEGKIHLAGLLLLLLLMVVILTNDVRKIFFV